jgi:hypothetical protein
MGERIGWVTSQNIYLEPTAAYRVAQSAATAAGASFPVTDQTLRKRLHEKGLLASTDTTRKTLTIRKTLEGSSKSVLHFSRAIILPESSDDGEENVR